MQYENNPANGFRDIARKRNTDARSHGYTAAQPDMMMTIYPAPTSWEGVKERINSIKQCYIFKKISQTERSKIIIFSGEDIYHCITYTR